MHGCRRSYHKYVHNKINSKSIFNLTVEYAKSFKSEFLKRNVKISKGRGGALNLQAMRLGIHSINALQDSLGEYEKHVSTY